MIKYIFLDMDNTIAENVTPLNVDYHEGMYLDKRPIQPVIDEIEALGLPVIIISKVQGGGSGIIEKRQWLIENLPFSTVEDYFIDPSINKVDMIKAHCKANNIKHEEVLVIDDKKDTLLDCYNEGFNVKYPQQLICDNMERIHNNTRRLVK